MELQLIYRGNIYHLDRGRPALLLGRDDGNDVVIASLFASRVHARLELRQAGVFVVDQSTNGTFVLTEDHSHEVHVRQAERPLAGRGWIGIGRSPAQHGLHAVRFAVRE